MSALHTYNMLAFILIFAAGGSANSGSGYDNFVHFWNTYLNYPGFEAWKFFNLALFIALMVYLIKKPLSEAFKARREMIRAELIRAEQEKQAALVKLTAAEARLARLDGETAEVREHAEAEAEAEKNRILEQIEVETKRLREQANGEIERANKIARLRLRRFSAEESIRLAEEKIKKEINAEKDARLVKANIEAIGGLN